MAADPGACVAANIVFPRFLGPEIDHLGRRRCPTGYRIDVLAIAVVWAMAQAARGNQMVGPVLRHLGELIRPDQRRDAHAATNGPVCPQHCPIASAAVWPFLSGNDWSLLIGQHSHRLRVLGPDIGMGRTILCVVLRSVERMLHSRLPVFSVNLGLRQTGYLPCFTTAAIPIDILITECDEP